MSHLTDGTTVTSTDAHSTNAFLAAQGFTVRYIETWHGQDGQSFIHWDAPQIAEADLPF